MTGTIKIQQLKQDYVRYFESVPVQKYAAMAIARDEDTIIRWRKEDPDFADAVQRAKAQWVRKRVIETKAEFALERLEKDVFGKPSETVIVSTYDKAIANAVDRDPNSPHNKKISEAITQVMMDMTKRPATTTP